MRRTAAILLTLSSVCALAGAAAPGAARAQSPQVAGLQIALWDAGYYRATVDGLRGPATTQAMGTK